MAQIRELRRQLHLVEQRLLGLRRRNDEEKGRAVVILPVVAERIALAEPVGIDGGSVQWRPEVRRREFVGEVPVGLVGHAGFVLRARLEGRDGAHREGSDDVHETTRMVRV